MVGIFAGHAFWLSAVALILHQCSHTLCCPTLPPEAFPVQSPLVYLLRASAFSPGAPGAASIGIQGRFLLARRSRSLFSLSSLRTFAAKMRSKTPAANPPRIRVQKEGDKLRRLFVSTSKTPETVGGLAVRRFI